MVHSRKSDHARACRSNPSWYLHWRFLRWPATPKAASLNVPKPQGMRSLSIVHAKDAEYLAALRSAEGTLTGTMEELNLGVFRAHVDGDRVGLKLVALKLIGGAGRVCE